MDTIFSTLHIIIRNRGQQEAELTHTTTGARESNISSKLGRVVCLAMTDNGGQQTTPPSSLTLSSLGNPSSPARELLGDVETCCKLIRRLDADELTRVHEELVAAMSKEIAPRPVPLGCTDGPTTPGGPHGKSSNLTLTATPATKTKSSQADYACSREYDYGQGLHKSKAIKYIEIDCYEEQEGTLEILREKFHDKKYRHFVRVQYFNRSSRELKRYRFATDAESAKNLQDILQGRKECESLGKLIDNLRKTEKLISDTGLVWDFTSDKTSHAGNGKRYLNFDAHHGNLDPQKRFETHDACGPVSKEPRSTSHACASVPDNPHRHGSIVIPTGNTRDAAIVIPSDDTITVCKLTEIDLDGGLASTDTSNGGAHSLALPLLSADSFYKVDAGVAARAALSAVQQFLAKHPADAALRIFFVEEAGSAGARALRQNNNVTDPRLALLTSYDPKAIVQLGEKGVPCGYVAVEADKLFYKGKRPSRSRSQHVYDKSGKEEFADATVLGAATSARYTTAGKLGEAYDVTLVPFKKSAPLLTVAKCHTVIYVIVPSRNTNHKLEDCYVKDDVECSSILQKCYTSLLDSFFQLSMGSPNRA